MFLQRQSQTLRPMATAHLAQTMMLLELTASELRQKVDSALANNPALELIEERRCPTCKRILAGHSACPVCSRPVLQTPDQPIVFVSSREDFQTHTSSGLREENHEEEYGQTLAQETLPEFVLRQVAPDLAASERPLAAHVLTNLDEDGLLTISLLEIARYHHVPVSAVEKVVRLIQRAEPVGVASSNPQEALLVQLEVLSESQPVHQYAKAAIEQGMDLLSRRRYPELASRLGISTNQAREAAEFIRTNLNPFPARAHWGETLAARQSVSNNPFVYHCPDVIIQCLNDREDSPLVVEISLPLPGTLQINPLFRQAIKEAPPEKVSEWRADLEQASLLVKCLQQRNHTMVRLMRLLTTRQRDYILQGNAHMQPLTRAELSRELDVHESTISRAVSTKAVQLPNGHIVPMSIFFDRSLHIRTALKEIVESENQPLSDTEIGQRLAEQGFQVARRTVAKYRSMEGILPAHLRKPVRSPSQVGSYQSR